MSFQVIHSILAPQALVDILERRYHFGKVNSVQYYSGGFNDTFVFSTLAGETYYLRAYRRLWRTVDDIHYEIDVLNHLKQKDFPAIRPGAEQRLYRGWEFSYLLPNHFFKNCEYSALALYSSRAV